MPMDAFGLKIRQAANKAGLFGVEASIVVGAVASAIHSQSSGEATAWGVGAAAFAGLAAKNAIGLRNLLREFPLEKPTIEDVKESRRI